MRMWLVVLGVWAAGLAWADQAPHTWPEMVRQDLRQGGFYIGKVPPGSKVVWGKDTVAVAEDGLFVVGFERFSPGIPLVTRPIDLAMITPDDGFQWLRRKQWARRDRRLLKEGST